MIRTICLLTFVAVLAAALLAYVNHLTRDSIAANRSAHANQQLRDLVHTLDENGLCDAGIHVLEIQAKGYGGNIQVAVVYQHDDLLGVRVLTHSETPGYSDILEPTDWIGSFGKRPSNEIDAVTRATITSKAILRAVEEANRTFQRDGNPCSLS